MLKRFMAGLLAAAVLTAPTYADTENKYTAESSIQAYADTLEDGNYYVPVKLWHEMLNQESMGNIAFTENPNALVKVNNGVATIDIATNPVKQLIYYSALKNLQYTNMNGDWQYAKPIQYGNITAYGYDGEPVMDYFDLRYLRIFEIKVAADQTEYCPVQLQVPYTPMQNTGEWMQARLKFDWANAVKTDDTSITPNPISPENTTQTTSATESTTESTTVSTTESTTETTTESTTESTTETTTESTTESTTETTTESTTESTTELTTETTEEPVSADDTIVFGDIDFDGKVTASDAAYALQKTLISTFVVPIQKKTSEWVKYSDVNCDGDVTASDATYILQKTLISTFELPCERKYGKK